MPTYSDAIADGDFTSNQKPQPQLKQRPKRPKEFWDVEPGEAGTEGWRDDPDDPTAPQLGSEANLNPDPTPPRATDPTTVQPQRAPQQAASNVTITAETPAPVKSRVDNPKWLEYLRFVDSVTSDESKVASQFIARTAQLQAEGCKVERLLTAAVGISAEGGEFLEIVKKIAFQGKPYDEASINHLKIELGDVLWYVAQACMALDVSLDDVIAQNITKLAARYPDGHFNSYFSENRRIDDL
jgi:NTP pyrophosphatase (non-canonical NTP hydrolase)